MRAFVVHDAELQLGLAFTAEHFGVHLDAVDPPGTGQDDRLGLDRLGSQDPPAGAHRGVQPD